MSERGIQIEGNVFCPVCECYMSQEIICSRKNAETQDPRLFCGQDVTVQPCGPRRLKEKGTRADAFIILTSLLLLKQRL